LVQSLQEILNGNYFDLSKLFEVSLKWTDSLSSFDDKELVTESQINLKISQIIGRIIKLDDEDLNFRSLHKLGVI